MAWIHHYHLAKADFGESTLRSLPNLGVKTLDSTFSWQRPCKLWAANCTSLHPLFWYKIEFRTLGLRGEFGLGSKAPKLGGYKGLKKLSRLKLISGISIFLPWSPKFPFIMKLSLIECKTSLTQFTFHNHFKRSSLIKNKCRFSSSYFSPHDHALQNLTFSMHD